jgi:DNA helicase-2/ATP-dependent DNA helicase PcrA
VTAFAPTAQQAAFLTALTETTAHLALVARAGCGKTSTILLGVAALASKFPTAEILVCAFNKAIADEVSAKLKKEHGDDWRRIGASTLHGMGWGLVKFAYRLDNNAIDDKKVFKIIESHNEPVFETYGAQIAALVRYAKQAGVGFFGDLPIASVDVWAELADHFDVNGFEETSELTEVIEAAQNIYKQSLADTKSIDFDDMILFPLIKSLRVKFTKDYIFLDEAQDLSRARQALARKFLNPQRGRMIVVGDDRQAIYGFSGADAAALPNLSASLGATVLPLSVTWRCPKAVVRLAQTLVADIEAAPEAPEGEVLCLEALPLQELATTDAILCRNTAPLITTAYALIRAGKPAKVEGRAIGEGLAKLALRWKVKTIAQLLSRLEIYRDREVQKAMAKGSEAKAEEVNDRVQTLVEIAGACQAKSLQLVSDVVDFIRNLFADGATDCTILATYHRAKGREWDRVFLIEHSARCPSRAARQDWQRQQEANLAYVAFTRAKRVLAFVG